MIAGASTVSTRTGGKEHSSYVSGRTCDYYVPHEPRCKMEDGKYVTEGGQTDMCHNYDAEGNFDVVAHIHG